MTRATALGSSDFVEEYGDQFMIRWGMIGCGDVTEVKSGPAFSKAHDSELVAVMSRDGKRAEAYARRHGVPRHYDDADAIIGDEAIDAVYIATPPISHRSYTLACAAAGKPVYVEKPMATTHEDAREMVDACKAADVPLWVAYYRRALPRLLAVKAMIDEGQIGDVRVVRSYRQEALTPVHAESWRTDPEISGGGMFFDGVCHVFDFLDFLFGPIGTVAGFARSNAGSYRAEDTVTASYEFESGVLGAGTWCFAAGVNDQQDEIVGSDGRIIFSIANAEPIQLHRAGESMQEFVEDPLHVQQPLIQTIVDELHGVGSCVSTGVSALRTAWVMDQILEVYRDSLS
ncbi:MAG: Gfo/Idh/MocA family oxidoreductase [Dehalococcoidia bacterium]